VEPYAYEFYKLMFDSMGGWERRIEHNLPLRHDDPSRIRDIKPLYTHPQPTEGTTPVVTIPEPSEEDAKVAECDRVRHLKAISAYGSAGVDERYDMAMRAALTTYTARLRDRIGGGR
jgi:hypothetical protein